MQHYTYLALLLAVTHDVTYHTVHFTPLVIHALRGGHTHTRAHTHAHTQTLGKVIVFLCLLQNISSRISTCMVFMSILMQTNNNRFLYYLISLCY